MVSSSKDKVVPTVVPRRVVVVGQGYVGLPLAMRAVECDFDVIGFDLNVDRVKRIAAGESPVEDITDERLQAALASGRFKATTYAAETVGFETAVISVPTPLREGVPDLSFIESAAASIGSGMGVGCCVVLESTTYPGTTEELMTPILEEASGLVAGTDFHVGYSPERIDPGNAEWRFENTPKVVSGIDDESLAAVVDFYGALVETVVPVSSPKEAELTKLLENTFRHVNIALVNELAMFAEALSIDIWEAIDAASTKPFGYMRFTPGPGVGGHCLPIDPSYLSWRVRRSLGEAFRFVELANDINEHMPDYVVSRLSAALNERELPIKNRNILLLGLAYKKNTGDARESPSQPIAEKLLQLGADLSVCDPHVGDDYFPVGAKRVDLDPGVVAAADAVLLLVDHDDFDLELIQNDARFVLDTRHCISGSNVQYL